MGRGPSTSFQCTFVTITFCAHWVSRCLKCFLPARSQRSHLTPFSLHIAVLSDCIHFEHYYFTVSAVTCHTILLHCFSSNMPYNFKNWIERVCVWQTKKPQTPFHHFVKKILSNQITGARGDAVGWGTALQAGKVAGSIPDGVVGIFQRHSPSGSTMVLEFTQPLTKKITRNISWGRGVKAAGA